MLHFANLELPKTPGSKPNLPARRTGFPADSSSNRRHRVSGVPQSVGASLHTAICPHISGVFVHVSHKHVPASKTNADCRVELPTFSVCMSEYYVLSMFDCFHASRARLTSAATLATPEAAELFINCGTDGNLEKLLIFSQQEFLKTQV